MDDVLAPVVESPEPSLIFTVRSDALSRHPGEVSFPGGLVDEGESLADAARREAFEEIGLDPALPRIVGALPAVHTYVSAILAVIHYWWKVKLDTTNPRYYAFIVAALLGFRIWRAIARRQTARAASPAHART